MKINRLIAPLLALMTVVALTGAAAVPTQPRTTTDLRARLVGSRAFPRADGQASYRVNQEGRRTSRDLSVSVSNVRQLRGRRLFVDVHGRSVGSMLVSRNGTAHLARSRDLPNVRAGWIVRVRTANGTLVVSGTFRSVRR